MSYIKLYIYQFDISKYKVITSFTTLLIILTMHELNYLININDESKLIYFYKLI
jgi:hypothetical protein